jgi:LDH2 family malate/lactate/ureidoglycolate dehydrogenase
VAPLGGPKGYPLTLAVGLLSTMLSDAAFGRDVGDLYEKTATAQDCGHLFGVLPVAAFCDLASYRARIGKAMDDVCGAKRAPGVERIYLPGEREHLSLLHRRAHGIPLGAALVTELRELGQDYDEGLKTR